MQGSWRAGMVLVAGSLLCLAACSPGAPAGPTAEDAVLAYLSALERGDADAAYDLLDPELLGGRDRLAFRIYLAENREELVEQAREAAAAVRRREADLRAVVAVDDEEVEVVRESDGEWRLARPLWPPSRRATPASLLDALADDLTGDDLFDDPARTRLACIVHALREAAAARAETPEAGGESPLTLPLRGRGSVTLIRTGAHWRVRDFDLPCRPETPPAAGPWSGPAQE